MNSADDDEPTEDDRFRGRHRRPARSGARARIGPGRRPLPWAIPVPPSGAVHRATLGARCGSTTGCPMGS